MIDISYIGQQLPVFTAEVELGRLQFFAKAIGETNPLYLDAEVAKAAGYRALPATPTFLFSLMLEHASTQAILEELGIAVGDVLHGEQGFTYHQPVCAGDTLTYQPVIADIYSKKNGAMEFFVRDFDVHNQRGELAAEMRFSIIVMHTKGATK